MSDLVSFFLFHAEFTELQNNAQILNCSCLEFAEGLQARLPQALLMI
jgi:hypothetical protein